MIDEKKGIIFLLLDDYHYEIRECLGTGRRRSQNITQLLGEYDPIYIFDCRFFRRPLKELIDQLDDKKFRFMYVINDWVPRLILGEEYNQIKDLAAFSPSILSLLENNFKLTEKGNYILTVDGQTDSLLKFFIRHDLNPVDKYLEIISDNVGMYYYAKIETEEAYKSNAENVLMHWNIVGQYHSFRKSFLYSSLLNKFDYGVSIVNHDYKIIYANKKRRNRYGNNLLGRFCYEIFPEHSQHGICENCVMTKVLLSDDPYATSRAEIHKLMDQEKNVYLVSETTCAIYMRNKTSGMFDRFGVNVVRDSTPRLISREYKKIIQRIGKFDEIIRVLKLALVGGSVAEFKQELEPFYNKNKDFIDPILAKLSYNQESEMLNFGFSRFRYYRNTVDIFDANAEIHNGKTPDILQIYNAFNKEGIDRKLLGKSFKFKEIGHYLCRKLSFTKAGITISEHKTNIEENSGALKYITEINLYENGKMKKWYDLELLTSDGEILGYISVDWQSEEDIPKETSRLEELQSNLVDFVGFVNQAILHVLDLKKANIISEIKALIDSEYKDLQELFFVFSRRLCNLFSCERCEIFRRDINGVTSRDYLYYRQLSESQCTRLSSTKELGRKFENEKNVIGYSLKVFLDQIYKNIDTTLTCINILDYEQFNQEHKLSHPDALIVRQKELEILSGEEYLGQQVKINNCLISPMIYSNDLIGAVRLSNNLKKGHIHFPKEEHIILKAVADHLAVKVRSEEVKEREKALTGTFLTCSELLEQTYKDYGKKATRKRIKANLLEQLPSIIHSDAILFYLVYKDKITFKPYLALSFSYPKIFLEEKLRPQRIDENSTNDNTGSWEEVYNLIKEDTANNYDVVKTSFQGDKFQLIRYIKKHNDPYAVLILQRKTLDFSQQDRQVIESITTLLEAIVTMGALKEYSFKIMENIAHQTISPLGAISGHCDQLLRNLKSPGSPKYFHLTEEKKQNKLRLIKSQIDHPIFVAKNYRFFLDFEMGKEIQTSLEQFNLTKLLINAASSYQALAIEEGITRIHVMVNKEETTLIDSDKNLLAHVFYNLIDNALKYSRKGTEILIFLKKTETNIIIEVRNEGLLIEKKDFERIFERQFRTREAKKRFEQGSGLGLLVARKILEKLNGSINLKSSTIEKTSFEITLCQ